MLVLKLTRLDDANIDYKLQTVLRAVLTKKFNFINSDKPSSTLRTKILDTAKYTQFSPWLSNETTVLPSEQSQQFNYNSQSLYI